MATYAHLALAEPIAHPGRGMPVLSSTVHIARHALSSWAQTIFLLPFLTHLCTVLLLGRPCGLLLGALFWQQDMPISVPLHSP